MSNIVAYIVLIFAVILGTAANGFAKGANGFTLLMPSLLTAITIVGCMFTLSIVMKTIPVGITYASDLLYMLINDNINDKVKKTIEKLSSG